MSDLRIVGGKVYDPLLDTSCERDVLVRGDKIAKLPGNKETVFDAKNCIVVPGLIDYHIHVFKEINKMCVNADLACIPNGVTTAVDGGTCGAPLYPYCRVGHSVNTNVTIKSYLNISSVGIISPKVAENVDPDCIEEDLIKKCFEKYDELVALKLRNSLGIVEENNTEPLISMVKLASDIGCNAVVHTTDNALTANETVKYLRKNDVFCHMYQGRGNTILDDSMQVYSELFEAKSRGVLFDACNGNANFSFKIAKAALEQGFEPDIISSDLTPLSMYKGCAISMPYVMSKYLNMGMSINKILKSSILTPARLINDENDLATLEPESVADIAVFKVIDKKVEFKDIDGDRYIGNKFIKPMLTVKGGDVLYSQLEPV